MKQPFFSIIVPTFNSEKYIERCLNSIFSQSFQNFEILIIDGCSDDSTLHKIEQITKSQKISLILVTENDTGVYDAMNKGICLSHGKWLYFLGSDDELFNADVLDKISRNIVKNPFVDIVYGNVTSTRFGGVYDGYFDSNKLYDKNICHQSIFYKREVFEIIGGFNLRYNLLADYDSNIKWFFNDIIKNIYVDLVIANYADGGISSCNSDLHFLEDKDIIFLKYKNKLDFNLCIRLLINLSRSKKENKEYFYYLLYKIEIKILMIINNMKTAFI